MDEHRIQPHNSQHWHTMPQSVVRFHQLHTIYNHLYMAERFLEIQDYKHKLLAVAGWGFMGAYRSGKQFELGALAADEAKRMKKALKIDDDEELYSIVNLAIGNEVHLRQKLNQLFSPDFAKQLGTSRYTDGIGSCHSVKIRQNLAQVWGSDNFAHIDIKWNPNTGKYQVRWELKTEINDVRYISISLHVVNMAKAGHFAGAIRDSGRIYVYDPNGQLGFYEKHNGQDHDVFGAELTAIIQRKFKEDEVVLDKGPVFNTLKLNTCEFSKGSCTCWVVFLQKLYWDLRKRSIIDNIGYSAMISVVQSKIPCYVFTHLFMNYCNYLMGRY